MNKKNKILIVFAVIFAIIIFVIAVINTIRSGYEKEALPQVQSKTSPKEGLLPAAPKDSDSRLEEDAQSDFPSENGKLLQ